MSFQVQIQSFYCLYWYLSLGVHSCSHEVLSSCTGLFMTFKRGPDLWPETSQDTVSNYDAELVALTPNSSWKSECVNDCSEFPTEVLGRHEYRSLLLQDAHPKNIQVTIVWLLSIGATEKAHYIIDTVRAEGVCAVWEEIGFCPNKPE